MEGPGEKNPDKVVEVNTFLYCSALSEKLS